MTFAAILDIIGLGFEIGGLLILLASGLSAIVKWFVAVVKNWRTTGDRSENEIRLEFGHRITFALEFFIGADIILSIKDQLSKSWENSPSS